MAARTDKAHWDGYPASVVRTMPTGQRLVTALGYLTTVASGGGTLLAHGMVVPALQGRLLVLHNTGHGSTSLDLASRHAGLPVGSGEKWAFNLWFKEYVSLRIRSHCRFGHLGIHFCFWYCRFAILNSIEARDRATAKGYAPAWTPIG